MPDVPIDYKPEPPPLTLRDYFAMQALVGVLVARATLMHAEGCETVSDMSQESIAEEAYELADAMLEERAK